MNKFIIDFDTENDAFVNGNARQEIHEILSLVRLRVDNMDSDGLVKDSNGNTIGYWMWS